MRELTWSQWRGAWVWINRKVKRKRKEFLFHFFFLQFLCHFLVFDRHARMRHKVLVFDHMAVTLRVRQGNENRYARQQAIK